MVLSASARAVARASPRPLPACARGDAWVWASRGVDGAAAHKSCGPFPYAVYAARFWPCGGESVWRAAARGLHGDRGSCAPRLRSSSVTTFSRAALSASSSLMAHLQGHVSRDCGSLAAQRSDSHAHGCPFVVNRTACRKTGGPVTYSASVETMRAVVIACKSAVRCNVGEGCGALEAAARACGTAEVMRRRWKELALAASRCPTCVGAICMFVR